LATDATLNRVLRPPEHAVDSTLAAGLSLPGSSYRGRTWLSSFSPRSRVNTARLRRRLPRP